METMHLTAYYIYFSDDIFAGLICVNKKTRTYARHLSVINLSNRKSDPL